MEKVTVIDARMGRGKQSAAIRYMNEHCLDKKFLYITPYLTEVDRICECCDFDQPDDEQHTKQFELKRHLHHGDNVAAQHSLFYLIDDESLEIIRRKHYCLIIDESIEVVSKVQITAKDMDIILQQMAEEDENGRLRWKDPEYSGKFDGYKEIADAGALCHIDTALVSLLDPKLFMAFDEVYLMTYLFGGQLCKAYFDYCGIPYEIHGVETDEDGFRFQDKEDCPPPVDYRNLISIVDSEQMNMVGDGTFALSYNWYKRRAYDDDDMATLRTNLNRFFRYSTQSVSDNRMWCTFKEFQDKVTNKGRFRQSFLQICSRATNQYRNKTCLAYLANRFVDPNIVKFFRNAGIEIDSKQFALSEMLQWIWRSAIRDGNPITIYIPSRRMRQMLEEWIDSASVGGDTNA